MEVLFHPTVLRILHEWKKSQEEEIPVDLLALMVDCKLDVDYDWMDRVLYSYKKTSKRRKDRIKTLKEFVESKFKIEMINEKDKATRGVYLLKDLALVSGCVRKLLKGIRKDFKRSRPDGALDSSTNIRKKEVTTPGILKFVQIEGKKKSSRNTLGQFSPISFGDEVIISTLASPINSTVRIRKDLQNPKRLSFIKFSDQLKPPFYGFREEKLHVRNSLLKLPQVLDYEHDSDWEDAEDAETIGTTEEESEEEEGSYEWIELDSERREMSRLTKKPSLSFPSFKLNISSLFSPSWASLPLVDREVFPEELSQELIKELPFQKDLEEFIRKFGNRYVIKQSAINDKVKTLELGDVIKKMV
ncbi:hypothetical protein EROM_090980 [Encephalitozoon romaleae SJ-2008]|uniref:Chromatin assembly factor 1 subunit A dimerization domain-containing protein n=1 Tax=Encephalitozoon romaleae (strain SJ-2008) TaxID=1178016 RepID=I7APF6_ENCRO|nr:hypothetical protein EROM_090980 [Encephalitozoon romaleae SJ-2008]AFN83714.1 hypothetical protein EROM_090980 [Encephalitozoon romaleae SJ-2008]